MKLWLPFNVIVGSCIGLLVYLTFVFTQTFPFPLTFSHTKIQLPAHLNSIITCFFSQPDPPQNTSQLLQFEGCQRWWTSFGPYGADPSPSRAATGEHTEAAVVAAAIPNNVAAVVSLHRAAEDGRCRSRATPSVSHPRYAHHCRGQVQFYFGLLSAHLN